MWGWRQVVFLHLLAWKGWYGAPESGSESISELRAFDGNFLIEERNRIRPEWLRKEYRKTNHWNCSTVWVLPLFFRNAEWNTSSASLPSFTYSQNSGLVIQQAYLIKTTNTLGVSEDLFRSRHFHLWKILKRSCHNMNRYNTFCTCADGFYNFFLFLIWWKIQLQVLVCSFEIT